MRLQGCTEREQYLTHEDYLKIKKISHNGYFRLMVILIQLFSAEGAGDVVRKFFVQNFGKFRQNFCKIKQIWAKFGQI